MKYGTIYRYDVIEHNGTFFNIKTLKKISSSKFFIESKAKTFIPSLRLASTKKSVFQQDLIKFLKQFEIEHDPKFLKEIFTLAGSVHPSPQLKTANQLKKWANDKESLKNGLYPLSKITEQFYEFLPNCTYDATYQLAKAWNQEHGKYMPRVTNDIWKSSFIIDAVIEICGYGGTLLELLYKSNPNALEAKFLSQNF